MNDRLTRADWLSHGLNVLREKGHESLKAEPMARALDVSRGSFYWHFSSLPDFHSAILEEWRTRITEAVIVELKSLPKEHQQLQTLVARALDASQDLEAAMRRWAGVDTAVAKAVARVDDIRVSYLKDVLLAHGIEEDEAKSRAVLLTWAFIGRAFAPQFTQELAPSASTDLSTLLLTVGRENTP